MLMGQVRSIWHWWFHYSVLPWFKLKGHHVRVGSCTSTTLHYIIKCVCVAWMLMLKFWRPNFVACPMETLHINQHSCISNLQNLSCGWNCQLFSNNPPWDECVAYRIAPDVSCHPIQIGSGSWQKKYWSMCSGCSFLASWQLQDCLRDFWQSGCIAIQNWI